MAEQQLIDHIRASQQSGISSDAIKQGLLSAGWNQIQINEAYQAVNIPKPPIPTPLSAKGFAPRKHYTSPYSGMLALVLVVSLLILSQNAVTDILDRFAPTGDDFFNSQQYRDYEQAISGKLQQPGFSYQNNPLYNQYLSDYKSQTTSPSFRMILNAIIVLPFWIITFLLFISLKEDRKKYEALLGAFYITSGWLLIFLFFNVARYIWNSDTVMGVYIVFGMLIVILTGAVWGVQKYRHSIEN